MSRKFKIEKDLTKPYPWRVHYKDCFFGFWMFATFFGTLEDAEAFIKRDLDEGFETRYYP